MIFWFLVFILGCGTDGMETFRAASSSARKNKEGGEGVHLRCLCHSQVTEWKDSSRNDVLCVK